jgi:hypothetical protein
MNDARIENIYINGYEKRKDFRPISDYIVEKYVTPGGDGKELTKEALDTISEVSAIDMAIGSESTKNQYLIIGSLIGIVGTIVIFKLKNKFKRKA